MQKNSLGLPSMKLLALAAAAGMIVGAGAVYMKIAASGNGDTEIAAAEVDCAVSPEGMAAIKPLIKGQVAALIPDTPRKFDAVSFQNSEGKAMSLDDFGGKTLLVNLWATWCGPCRAEMPALDALQQKAGSDQFQVLAINIDTDESDEKPRSFLEETGVKSLGLYRDNSLKIFNTLKKEGLVFGLPSTMLIDAKGCLIAHMNGPAVWDGQDALNLIKAVNDQTGV